MPRKMKMRSYQCHYHGDGIRRAVHCSIMCSNFCCGMEDIVVYILFLDMQTLMPRPGNINWSGKTNKGELMA